ncbi:MULTISPECIES: ABC transporter ATP-binding protein [unclassified Lysinibacillus]|uniref:ABC transporter ATP-binding protein n=1 Tax=unclassified Lysinibacillus TaxID=2636778 RepID=UPI002011B76A|nr:MULTISPECIES: ABC transporter ATP-binding protein [unclassified Lysinibacillus]MCL1696587.1 ABC transporter ATP-binding protein [Lysinibacillus sp. BPa_S21]MCL1698929.1 ABC transporter ATP-binding protein [Lysinibacillus sp. Bpr_S20]
MTDTLLEIEHLKVHFDTEEKKVTAVDDVSFSVKKGQIVGVVGESGCGKSVTAESILRLLDEKHTKYEGEIRLEGQNLLAKSAKEMREIRGNDIAMIFQDPMSSLNPVYTVGDQIMEALLLHQNVSKEQARAKAIDMLKLTGIPAPEKRVDEFPHQLSGGMRQRVMIAMALSCQPALLIADEPTTALDVTTQSQILDLIKDLKEQFNMGTIMITHDLGVVAEVCEKVVVMYLGQVIEESDVLSIFDQPLHPYTQGLLKSIPTIEGNREEKLYVIEGKVPTLNQIPAGCRFAPRCEFQTEECRTSIPKLESYGERKVRCWHFEEIQGKREATMYG